MRMPLTYYESPPELLSVVEASLAAVLARDPDCGAAHFPLGLTQVMAWQWQSAWQNLTRANELDPVDTELDDWGTWVLFISGEAQSARDQGADLTERAPVGLIMLAQAHGYAGEHDAVQPLLDEAERGNIYMCPYETAVAHLSRGDEAAGRSLRINGGNARHQNSRLLPRPDIILNEWPRAGTQERVRLSLTV